MKSLTYTIAYNELVDIQLALENNKVPLGQLSKTVARADVLIQFCKKERSTNQKVKD